MKRNQQGGVSLFVVVFATLLLSVITVGFVQLMLSDQRQAVDNDLSQSAYDSAMAGVEDAKRVLLKNLDCGGTVSTVCNNARSAVSAGQCNTISRAFSGSSSHSERPVEGTTGNDEALNQAYTCVVITPDTPDYIAPSIRADDSVLVPLAGVSTFDRVRVSWFTSSDASGATTVNLPSFAPELPTPVSGLWTPTMPSLLRTQLIQTGSSFTLEQFDDNNAKSLFLYPAATGVTSLSYALDGRRSGSAAPQQIRCQTNFGAGAYACTATILLPNPVGGSAANRANAFLRVSPLYNASSVRVQLLNGGTAVNFNGVQPSIDSTGRANDVFRRVETRVEMNAEALYPRATLEVRGDLCKDFSVTDRASDYSNSCTP